MRISDWSSVVCSSDLCAPAGAREDVASGGRRAVRGGAAARLRLVECAEESHHPCAAGSALGQHAQVVGRAARECVCLLVLHLAAGAALAHERRRRLSTQPARAVGLPDAELPGLSATGLRVDRKSTRLNSSHSCASRMPSSACKKKKATEKNNIRLSIRKT